MKTVIIFVTLMSFQTCLTFVFFVLIFAHTMKVSIWSSFVLDLTDFHFKTKISEIDENGF